MLQPSIIKICISDPWLFTFDLLDPYSNEAVTRESTFATYSLYDSPMSTTALWSGDWERGLELDANVPGRVYVRVPEIVSKYLTPGLYTYRIELVSREHLTYSKKIEGTLEAVPVPAVPEAVLGETDPVARRLVADESKRALQAEEDIRSRMRPGPDGSTYIPDGGITTSKIADGAVTIRKLEDGVIPLSKIDPLAIADVDAVAQALIPYIRVGDVTSVDEGDDPEVTAHARDGYFFFNFALAPGYTPEITDDGFWKIGPTVTNVRAEGRDGAGISDISEVSSDPATGYTTYRITWSYPDGTVAGTYDFSLYSKPTTDEVSPNSIQPVTSSGVYSAMINDVPQQLLSDSKLMFSATPTELSDISTTITDFHVSRAYYLGQNFKRIPLESAEGIVALPDLIATDNLNGVGLDLHITTAESTQIDVSLELHRQEGTSYYSAFPYGLWKPAWAGAVAPIADAEFSIDSSNVLLGLAVIFSGETSWLRLTCTLGDLVSSDAVYSRVLTTDDYSRLQAQITFLLNQLSQ